MIFIGNSTDLYSQIIRRRLTRKQYIEKYKDIAIREMMKYGIPASIILSQGILESADGNSKLARKANNHFGIKCHKDWEGKTYYMRDDKRHECFRRYKNSEESYEDHSLFLSQRKRYAFLFNYDINDYKSWAYGLRKSGYSTNHHYAEMLIKIIENNDLYELDKQYTKTQFALNKSSKTNRQKIKYILPDEEDFSPISIGENNRKIFKNNGIKYIIAREGDTFDKIAEDFDIPSRKVCRYNDLKKSPHIMKGQIIYLHAKRRKAKVEFHIVKPNETMYYISQLYGIKLKQLYKKNKMARGSEPYIGQKLWLRKVKP